MQLISMVKTESLSGMYERGWLVGICVVVHGEVMFCNGAVVVCDSAVGLNMGRVGW